MLELDQRKMRTTTKVLLSLALFTMACIDEPPTASPHPSTPRRASNAGLSSARSRFSRPSEDAFVALADESPSSAGFVVDKEGNVTVFVADSLQIGNVSQALQGRISRGDIALSNGSRRALVRAKRVDFTFAQLSEWRDSAFVKLLGKVRGVAYDDVDEAINRVTIGMYDDAPATAKGEVIATLVKAGVPARAINFVALLQIEWVE